MKQLIFILISFIWMTTSQVKGQEIIGMHADSVKLLMKSNYKDFNLNTSSINKYYNYLKYEDRIRTKTFLVFLDEENRCKYYKEIYDYSLKKRVYEDLNNHFINIGDSLWKGATDEVFVTKKLKQNEWFFSITTRVVKND